MVNAKYGTKITNGPRVQMQTVGSKKKEDWTEVSKEQLAKVKLPASFEKLKEQKSYFYFPKLLEPFWSHLNSSTSTSICLSF